MESFLFRATVRDGGNRFSHAFLRIVVSKDVLFVPSTSSLTDGGSGLDGSGHFGLLASEDMVVVLAFTLAVIIVAIFVIIVVILALRRRGADGEHAGVGGGGGSHRRPGPVWAGSLNGGRVSGGNEEKMQLSGPRAYDVDHSCSNGTLAYCNGGSVAVGNGRTSTTMTGCGNGTGLNGYAKKNGVGCVSNGNHGDGGSGMTNTLSSEAKEKASMSNKATAVVSAYTSFDKMAAYSDDDVDSHVTCIGDRQSIVQSGCDVTANTTSTWVVDGHVMATRGCVPDVCAGRVLDISKSTSVKPSATAADLNYVTMPTNFRTSWQSLPIQNDQPRRPVVVFIRDQDELYKDNSGRLVVDDTTSDPFNFPLDNVGMMSSSSPASGYPDHPLAAPNGHLPNYYSTMPRLAMTSSARTRRAGALDEATSDYFQNPTMTTTGHTIASEHHRLPAPLPPPPLINSSGFGCGSQWSSASASMMDKNNVR